MGRACCNAAGKPDRYRADRGQQWPCLATARQQATQRTVIKCSKVIELRANAVAIDAGPLVMVETKRDLRNMTLPFEQAAQQQQ
jgi:hypothetical protein